MAKETGANPGIVLFPEDIERIQRCVRAERRWPIIYALSRYTLTGERPTEEELGEGGLVAFEFIFEKVEKAQQNYRENAEKRRAAAEARWRKQGADGDAPGPAPGDAAYADACIRTPTGTGTGTKTGTGTGTKTGTGREGGDGVTPTPATLPDNLIDTYGLVKSSQTRTALTEDLQKAGERRLREALKQAALSNSRGKVSVNFYRTILYDTGRAKEPARDYQSRHYSDEEFKAMEVDLDGE